mgnify:CR=1 FL=1
MGLAQPRTSKQTRAANARVMCVLLHYTGKPESETELGALLADFAYRASAEEAGLLSYVITQAMGSARHFTVHAQFSDWDAFEAHADTEHMQRLLPRLTELLAAPISMELFRGV